MKRDDPPALALLAARALAVARRCEAADSGAALRERAALHVLDWLGNAAFGATRGAGPAMARWLSTQPLGAVATLGGRAAEASAAAAYHGALGSALEMDDVHRSSVLHPGPVVLPAAWACATTPAALLAAVVAGYEAMVRIGRALGPTHYRFWHPTATAGAFGAAAAAAVAMGLDAERTAQAMALAGTRAGGLWQVRHEDSTGKLWHMAGAASAGVAAAQAAAAGMTGPLAVLEGPSGWFAATAPDANAALLDEDRAPDGRPWIDDVSFKPWPACRHAHPAMDALRMLLAEQPLAAEDVQRIEVHTYADALRFCDRAEPTTDAQARFSIQHALAAWLAWGEPALAHYEGAALHNAAVAALRARIVLLEDASIQSRYPAQYGARVRLTRRDGEVFIAGVRDTFGDPARPMSRGQLLAKARMLMQAAGWAAPRADAALAACLALPQAQSLDALCAALAGGGTR